MLKLTITFSDYTEQVVGSPEEAEKAILEAFANDVTVETIYDQNEKSYGATWSVKVEPLTPA